MSVSCPDCGADWSKVDLANAACHGCGEILLPDDLDNLRQQLGIEEAKPPEIAVPVVEADPIALPNFEDCPNCQTPLMEDDLAAWRGGSDCPYCGQSSNHEPNTFSTDTRSTIDDTEPSTPSSTGPTIALILNSGSKAGKKIELPLGIIGRNHLSQAIGHPSYEEALQKISREHIEIILSDDSVAIKDMGSRNGTYINNNRIVGTQPTELGHGSDLALCGISFCLASSAPGSLHIAHVESGIRLEYPPEHTDVIHLGRLTEDDRREPWCRMASASMEAQPDQDHTTLGYISRRHLYVKNDSGTIFARHEDGKDSVEIYFPTSTEAGEGRGQRGTSTEFSEVYGPQDLKPLALSLHRNIFHLLVVGDS